MFYILNESEIKEFTNKYLPQWSGSIYDVNRIDYKGIYEYLVNGHYIITVYPNGVIKQLDLQIN